MAKLVRYSILLFGGPAFACKISLNPSVFAGSFMIIVLLTLLMQFSSASGFCLVGVRTIKRSLHSAACAHQLSYVCRTKESLESLGYSLSKILSTGDVIFLQGNLLSVMNFAFINKEGD